MKRATYNEILELWKRVDSEEHWGALPTDIDPLVSSLNSYFLAGREERVAVLGIDIYRYSKFEGSRQRLVPILFRWLTGFAVATCKSSEPYLFQRDQFRDRFVSTGDGGFLIFDTPLHALVFGVYFQLVLTAYNSYSHFPRLRRFLGPVTLRYALTFDLLAHIDDNYYGRAVINNARMMSRDTLNRFLADEPTVGWFFERLGTIESLMVIDNNELAKIGDFETYSIENVSTTLLFPPRIGGTYRAIRNMNVQKIGIISAKDQEYDVYNLHLQVALKRFSEASKREWPVVVTLGNLNPSGLSA